MFTFLNFHVWTKTFRENLRRRSFWNGTLELLIMQNHLHVTVAEVLLWLDFCYTFIAVQ